MIRPEQIPTGKRESNPGLPLSRRTPYSLNQRPTRRRQQANCISGKVWSEQSYVQPSSYTTCRTNFSPSHMTRTPGQPVLALTPSHQATTRVPICMSRLERDSNRGLSLSRRTALTTRPSRRLKHGRTTTVTTTAVGDKCVSPQ